ncbi:glycosyltransferase family A protein [Pedobacter sp. ASV28]|uniref:glycosyltransferase family 2 protein n=1 Tax=Pedobacter sp. ASV28 TaxID=2795123 RepID=UPI0018EC41C1|nr:glycosyltransferase family A protein [Pedobacter sp. ASV28]
MITPTLFSILVANYNNGHYIAECLDSLIKQDYESIEIIIVDDASTDNSIHIIKQYQNQHPNIFLFHNSENKGVGYTKKRCIDEAKGEILGFVDPDDAIALNAITKMIEMHKKNPQASLVYSNLYYCDEKLHITGKKYIKQVPQGQYDFFNDDGDISAFTSFKKSSYLKTIGINPYLKNAEDQDLYFKLYDVGEAILIDERLYYYRIHIGGLSTLANVDRSYFWRWKVILKRAEEKGINMEQAFLDTFIRKTSVNRYIKIDQTLRSFFFPSLIKKFKKQ